MPRHDDFVSRATTVPHNDGSDALSHASSEGCHELLGDMNHALHSAHAMILPPLGPLPVFGSPAPSEAKEHPSKKRKSIETNASTDWGQDDDDSAAEDSFVVARPHVAWSVNNHETWHRIFDPQMNEIMQPGFRAEIDKGFRHSTEGEGWICQKKNHFQVTRQSRGAAAGKMKFSQMS